MMNDEELKPTEELPEEESREEAPEESAVDSLKADHSLTFISDDNLNFYLASKAYYEERNYEEAIAKFQATIAYEESNRKASSVFSGTGQSEPYSVIAKSIYWMGEAYIKMKQIDKAIEVFEQLPRRFRKHYLALAAQRRVALLKASYPKERESV